ncbi:MAG: hypothetical protein H6R00_4252 [Proteobacteria bacterium]|nr:hypothetical protein [Pseudomonadota bacterium]
MLFIVAMSGLMGFVAGVRVRLVPLILWSRSSSWQ